ncbi:MAG: RNA polymerase sigma factor [Phycisphaerales bacterium]
MRPMTDLRYHGGESRGASAGEPGGRDVVGSIGKLGAEEETAGRNPELPGLLQAAGEGDEEAWRAIIDLYARRVYALARSRFGASRHDLAEEITQSVFVTVASKLGKQNASGVIGYTEQGRFESWLFRVAMNRVRDEIRRSKRQAEPTDPEALGATQAAKAETGGEELSENLVSLRRAMGQLAEADREIVELRHHAGLSFKQIAELVSEPLGTLLARHHRALKKLKELMTGGGGGSGGGGAGEAAGGDEGGISPFREGATQ